MAGYSSRSLWKEFIENYVIPLKELSEILIGYWKFLGDKINDKPVDELIEDESIKTILLGGVGEDGEYSERSLALFYKKFFGVYTDVKAIVEYLKQELTPNAKGTDEKRMLIRLAEEILKITNEIINLAQQNQILEDSCINKNVSFEELINNPEKVADIIKEFYRHTLKVTINYNQKTLFLWIIRKITRRYLVTAYPEFKDEENFEELRRTVGLERYFEPEIKEKTEKDREIKRDYTIWYLPENSFGGMVCKLNEIIWEYFGKEQFRKDLEFLFDEVVDLRHLFIEKAKEVIGDWKFPDNIIPYDATKRHCKECSQEAPRNLWFKVYSFRYLISEGIFISEVVHDMEYGYIHEYGGRTGPYYTTVSHDISKINLLNILDQLSPLIFLGLVDIFINKGEQEKTEFGVIKYV